MTQSRETSHSSNSEGASSVSRQISALEEQLGTRLFNRTTRKLHLTEAGETYRGHTERIISDLAYRFALHWTYQTGEGPGQRPPEIIEKGVAAVAA
ncbi:MAG: LysR family transcriptional regulator [Alphaproteobacteria bacterium]